MIPSPVVPMTPPPMMVNSPMTLPVVPMMMSSPMTSKLGSPIVPFVPQVASPVAAAPIVSPMTNITGQTIGSTMLMSPAAGKPIQAPSPSIGVSPNLLGSTGTMEIEGYNLESNMIHNALAHNLYPAPFPEN